MKKNFKEKYLIKISELELIFFKYICIRVPDVVANENFPFPDSNFDLDTF